MTQYLPMRQRMTGKAPDYYGAPDWSPGSLNPLKDAFHINRGRALAGDADVPTGLDTGMPTGALNPNKLREQDVYPGELDLLAEVDDANGNGIFDAANAQPNIHPDAGVFAQNFSRPGYLARERQFYPSEVLDVNTGLPTIYTPANATYLDPRTPAVLRDRNLYEPGWPSTGGQSTPAASTWIPDQAALAIGDIAPGEEKHGLAIMVGIAGVGLGIFAATVLMGKKGKRKR